jgi:hypothetical protein
MSFVFKKGVTYSWPVKIQLPKDGGEFEEQSFEAVFKRIKQSEINDLLAGEGATDRKFCEAVMAGWNGILDESHNAIAFTSESLGEFLDVPGVTKAIVVAFLESVVGIKKGN